MEKIRTCSQCLILAMMVAWGGAQAATPEVAAPEAGAPAAAPLADSGTAPTGANAKPNSVRVAPHGQRAPHRTPEQVLDERVANLGKTLGLDSGQQVEVRKILSVQRDQLRQVWSDPSRSSADRVGASHAINAQTEDRIRSILNEEQRNQYIASKPAGAANEHGGHDLDYWMDQMKGSH